MTTKKKPSLKQKIAIVDSYFDAKKHELVVELDSLRAGWIEARFNKIEDERNLYKQKYDNLADALAALLTADQLDAAKVNAIDPEYYAINWMKLCIERHEAEKYNIKMTENNRG